MKGDPAIDEGPEPASALAGDPSPVVDEAPMPDPSGQEPPPSIGDRLKGAVTEWRRRIRTVTTLRAHDTTTREGRSLERYRRATLTSITSLLAHALGIGTGLLSVRITLSYLGEERYGLLMAVTSLFTWAALADFGLGNGAQNHLAEAYGQGDREAAARYVSTGLTALLGIAVVLGVVFMPLLAFVPWTGVLNVRDPSLVAETRQVVGAMVVCFLASFPLSLVPVIYASHQRGYVANLFGIGGSLLSLVALITATSLRLSLPWLIVATGGVSLLVTLVNLAYIVHEMPWLRPRMSLASRATLRGLAGTSAALLLFQLCALIINETQVLIVTRRLGLAKVAQYSIFVRVHILPIVVISAISGPMVTAFREAHVRGDADWLRSAFFRLTKIKMTIALGAAGLYFVLGNFAAGLLSASRVQFGPEVWGASALLLLVGVWNGGFNDLMIATNRLRFLVVMQIINAVVTSSLTYWFSVRLGIFGVVLATPLCSIFVTGWLLPWACRDLLGWGRSGRAA